jgi:uncharacterized protein YbbC (DUF1343 family)/CubicO group peptidase (beta-lactamase class C family)
MICRRILYALLAMTASSAQESAPPPAFAHDLDAAIDAAIAKKLIPGAVVEVGHAEVGHDGQVVYRKAYGSRALIPAREAMTEDTMFDIASLTKVVATTPSLMKLFEQGKLRIDDPVTEYLPDFQGGKSSITVRQLLTHFSGLRPDLDLKPAWSGYETGIARALTDKPANPPGRKFVYSDINFILLAEIVRKLSGETLDVFATRMVFEPLGMKDTMFRPPAELVPRIAPTEIDPDTHLPLRGVVHDDTSRYMGGVAGHAGLFSTAENLGRYARMLIDCERADGLFRALTVEKFTSPQSPPSQPILRGLGWDIDSPYSNNRGELFPVGSFGHTGFTGTDIWIDPASRTYLVLLTNSVHPHRGISITSLRARVATIVAAAYGYTKPGVNLTGYNDFGQGERRMVNRNGEVLTGLDVWVRDGFPPLAGKRVGLITNHTGLDRTGKRDVDQMLAAGINLRAIFSPEHGMAGIEDRENVGNAKDSKTAVPVYSLYDGKTRRPSDAMLAGIDTLVFDIQDVGARFYTYSCTMIYAMEEAARRKMPFYVLDRPNPITGVHVEGPMLEPALRSFTGCAPIPIRHGLTMGELAALANGEEHVGADLHVVKMEGWERGDWFDSTGLPWIDPSPNMRSLNAALLYPGIAMLEYSPGYSVGRGTNAPFEHIGAAWIHGTELAAFLNARSIPGIRVYPVQFRPDSSEGKGQNLEGVRFLITDRDQFDSLRFGLELAHALETLYPGKIKWQADRYLVGNKELLEALETGKDTGQSERMIEEELKRYVEKRKLYLLYPGE